MAGNATYEELSGWIDLGRRSANNPSTEHTLG